MSASSYLAGRPFLQTPGPTNIPDRVLRAMDRAIVDHRSPDFASLVRDVLPRLQRVWGTASGQAVLYPASGTGACEASLVNVLAPGDRVLSYSYGTFSTALGNVARHMGYQVDEVPLRWGQAFPADDARARLQANRSESNRYKAVLVVDNETSTGVHSNIGVVRQALDAADHDALLIVDAVSSLASMPFNFDEWRVDVAFTGSQKGLMLPPGLGVVCVGPRAVAVGQDGGSPRHFWDWRPILQENHRFGLFTVTPATLLLFGLRESLLMLEEEGLTNVFARHHRLASGVRAAVQAWGLDLVAESPASYSDTISAVRTPDGVDANEVMRFARETYGLTLGAGLGQLNGSVFRIGHLGALNEIEVMGLLGGVELALRSVGLPVTLGSGVAAAQAVFAGAAVESREPALAAAR